jgi:hypothetical protein
MRARAIIGVCCAGLLLLPAAADAAGTVTITETRVTFQAAAGIANDVTMTATQGSIVFTDAADVITEAEAACEGTGTNTVTCTSPDFTEGIARPGDMNDRVQASGSLRLTVEAGAGDDELTVSSSPDSPQTRVLGEDGNDRIATGDGNDSVQAGDGTDSVVTGGGDDIANAGDGNGDSVDLGPGNDLLGVRVTDGGDNFTGGPGRDSMSISFMSDQTPPADTAVDLTAGTVNATGEAGTTATEFEDVDLFVQASVTGTPGSNSIGTFTGADLVDPGAGQDFVTLGAGDDRALTRDGSPDSVLCGSGVDSAEVDQLDFTVGCETVSVAQVRPAAIELGSPGCAIAAMRARITRAALLRRGLRGAVECARPASLEVRLLAGAGRRRGGGIGIARAGDVILAERSLPLAGGRRAVRLRVARRLRRAIPRTARLRLQVVARDEFGNRQVVTRRLRVTSPRRRR